MTKCYKVVLIIIMVAIIFTSIGFGVYQKLQQNAINKFPNKSIKLIVPYKPGGGTDIDAKLLCESVLKTFNIKVDIEYKPSEDVEIGYKAICDAREDGYTIGFINIPTIVNLSFQKNTDYNEKNMIYIMNFSYDPCLLVVRSDSRFKNIDDFIKEAKKNPDGINVSNNGEGTSSYIATAELNYKASMQLTLVPFNGSNDMLRALEEGYVNASVAKLSEVTDGVQKGKYRILASFTSSRLKKFPGVPTLREKGYNVFCGSSRAIVAPKGVDEHIIKKLQYILEKSTKSNFTQKKADELNVNLDYKNQKELINLINSEDDKIKKLNNILQMY